MKNPFSQASWRRLQRVSAQAWQALRERPVELATESIERLHFWRVRPWVLLQQRLDSRLSIGDNPRVQSMDAWRIVGPDARIDIGDDVLLYNSSELVALDQGHITVGNACIFGEVRVFCRERITIGDHVLFSWNVFVQDYDAHPLDPAARRREIQDIHARFVPRFSHRPLPEIGLPQRPVPQPITIGNDVWIGANVTILKGVTIGDGAVIGAGSVVTRDIPPYTVAAGNPIRLLRTLSPAEDPEHATP